MDMAKYVNEELGVPRNVRQGNDSLGIQPRHPWRASHTQVGFVIVNYFVNLMMKIVAFVDRSLFE
ncbi:hypothetical protein BM221_002143 [Beauveria bassiana]|uniref:Uncharacterized protein n=1 Tax=Beauveria bassiana TaxID=176275 RepID=A0A2N6NXQ0_BEABA|nr:hypothetical protein BM221_002143 [Beauveria bassiana]